MTQHALSVTNLTKTYANGHQALRGISLDVMQGDFFALLGKNGAGKSTTIGIICSLVNKTNGNVSVFDYDLDDQLYLAKSCIGVVPQEMNFHPFEKISNVVINQAGYYGVPRNIAKMRMEYYFKKVGLWEKRDAKVLQLSGGMKRRLMIARALINEPKLLILDEPTAGVDIELRHNLWRFLEELNAKGTTIILTTHYLEEAEQLCKNVAIIDGGEIVEHSDMKSLINRLDTQTVILELSNPLQSMPENFIYPFQLLDPTTVEIRINKDQTLNQIFHELSKHQIIVKSLRNKTNRLEELFMDLIYDHKLSGDQS